MTGLKQSAKRVSQAREHLEREQEGFRTLVRKSHANGMTLRQIAAETGLSFGRIHQIVKS